VEIVQSVVVADETLLTLSNGAVINIRGADALWAFNIGGDAINGEEGIDKDFKSFSEDILGTSLPAPRGISSFFRKPKRYDYRYGLYWW